MERSRNTCFTSYDVSDPKFTCMMSYLVYQREKCPTTGNPHWQGYVEWVQPMSYEKMNEELELKSVHYESRKGTAKQASDYCKKADSRLSPHKEFGELSKQGERSDLKSVSDDILSGKKRFREIVMDHPMQFIKFHKGMEKLMSIARMSQFRDVNVTYVWGEAGIGKTHSVWTDEVKKAYADGDVYLCSDHEQGWFDGYVDQRYVIIDDFEGRMPLRDILRLCDKYPCAQWVKGGRAQIHVEKIFITANHAPETHYHSDPSWLRRLSCVIRAKPAQGVEGGVAPQ